MIAIIALIAILLWWLTGCVGYTENPRFNRDYSPPKTQQELKAEIIRLESGPQNYITRDRLRSYRKQLK